MDWSWERTDQREEVSGALRRPRGIGSTGFALPFVVGGNGTVVAQSIVPIKLTDKSLQWEKT